MSTQSTQLTKSTTKQLFTIVPNSIIVYSCKLNHLILPIYLYSSIHQQFYNDNIVDTNIAHISETFAPNNRSGFSVRVQKTIDLLTKDIQDTPDIPGFSAPLQYRTAPPEKPTSRFEYYFLNASVTHTRNYTLIYHSEYNTLISSSLNRPDLLNLYAYLKMRIQQYDGLSRSKDAYYPMKESLDTIASALSLGSKTISKYLPHIPFISINDGQGLIRNKPSIYTLKK